jgi:hypothetical protein
MQRILLEKQLIVKREVWPAKAVAKSLSGGVRGGFASPNDTLWWLWCGKAAPQPPEKA